MLDLSIKEPLYKIAILMTLGFLTLRITSGHVLEFLALPLSTDSDTQWTFQVQILSCLEDGPKRVALDLNTNLQRANATTL